jgi:hypothetical protein
MIAKGLKVGKISVLKLGITCPKIFFKILCKPIMYCTTQSTIDTVVKVPIIAWSPEAQRERTKVLKSQYSRNLLREYS